MQPDELDRIFSRADTIVPSSGFVASVMEAVQLEAVAPPPIPFPWKRALPGIGALLVTLALAITEVSTLLRNGIGATPLPPDWTARFERIVDLCARSGAGWILVGMLLTYVFVKLSMRLALRRKQGTRPHAAR